MGMVYRELDPLDDPALVLGAETAEQDDVLVIDDDPAIVGLLVSLLRDEEGFAVRAAHSTAQVLRLPPLRPPRLILLDVTLPGERVTQSVRRLRALPGWQDAAIVICSGQEDLPRTARRTGARGFLRKPFDLDAVVALAERYARHAE
jgi:CheY-like chemotaxis protein